MLRAALDGGNLPTIEDRAQSISALLSSQSVREAFPRSWHRRKYLTRKVRKISLLRLSPFLYFSFSLRLFKQGCTLASLQLNTIVVLSVFLTQAVWNSICLKKLRKIIFALDEKSGWAAKFTGRLADLFVGHKPDRTYQLADFFTA